MKLEYTNESELVQAMEEYRRKKEEYNGWSNYATWRVNMEMVDSATFEEMGNIYESVYQLSEAIKEQCQQYLEDEAGWYVEGLRNDYARAFLDGVNWYEIAENMVEDNSGLVVDNQ